MQSIGIRFDISKVGSSSYGLDCWKIFWKAFPPQLLKNSLLREGDTAATLNGKENVFCIEVSNEDSKPIEWVRYGLPLVEDLKAVCSEPMLIRGYLLLKEPFAEAGEIDSSGNLAGKAGLSRMALDAVLKDRPPDWEMEEDFRKISPYSSLIGKFEFPDGHTKIFRTHDAAHDNWPVCNLNFSKKTFKVSVKQGHPCVDLWDSEAKDVSMAEYQPERFDDWKPDPKCDCPKCTTDAPEKLQIHMFVILSTKGKMDDKKWIKTLNKIIPKDIKYRLYERLFGGKRQDAARVLFLFVQNEKLKDFDLALLKEKLIDSFGPQTRRDGFGNVTDWHSSKRNIDPSLPTEKIEAFDPYSKTFIWEGPAKHSKISSVSKISWFKKR